LSRADNSLTIGDFRITMVRAGSYWWDGGAMFGVVPKTLWSRHCPADDLNRIEAGFNCFVVETGDQTILIETGGGTRHDDRARERMRLHNPAGIAATLAQHGFEAGAIDLVINTHLHWDHCCGNTIDENGKVLPALPKARYVTQRGELEHAREQHPRDAVSYRAVNYEPLIESGRMHLLDGDVEVAPGIEVRVAPGHNRDMMVVIARSRGQTWCQLADLTPYSVQVTPTWVTAFDLYPLQTIASKEDVLRRAADEGWWVSFAHDPKVSFARVEERGGKWTAC
jgi:glyoxylase-like metal-dependent hydrolase (beta-lactamase superfamily II)